MEQLTAILIADLSGYTALTESHGASAAADLIDQYIAVVESSLVGDSALHQIVGDEVLVVCASPDHLLATARRIMQSLIDKHLFLQIHGALHFGQLLKRGDRYFGTAINLTSRIASKAAPGSILCSAEFMEALPAGGGIHFKSIGSHSFKNLQDEKELFEMVFEKADDVFIDPVCRMVITRPESAVKHPGLNDVFFCSAECLSSYLKQQDLSATDSSMLKSEIGK